MIGTIKLLLVFVGIVVALNRRLELGAVLAGGAIVLGFLFGRTVPQVALDVWGALTSYETLRLVGIVIFIMMLSEVQRLANLIQPMVQALMRLFSDARVVLAVVPALIGLLPMPGGALFSAPMVEEVGTKCPDMTGNQKAFANYWFRHVWEYVLPLYPAIVLSSALLAIPVGTFIRNQWPLTVAAVLGGALVVWTRIPRNGAIADDSNPWKAVLTLARSLWPIVLIVALTMVANLELLAVLPVVILLLILVERPPIRKLGGALWRGLDWHIALVVIGIMVFQQLMETTGAVEHVSSTFIAAGIPPLVLIFLIPFIVGLATGVTGATFGVGLPVILPFMYASGSLYLPYALVMYAGGMAGVMLSPVHLCLILTRDFFKAGWIGTLAPVFVAQGVVVLVAVALAVVRF